MTALFPTFTNIWQRAKCILATDVKCIWQALDELEESKGEGFFDGFIYHPPIV
ncbi:hypothetical protein [Allocoleopsis sp.]|uniref:hypothetical protein n=1 Tax=Allocoleopsis sp. TaxID=3088169 RepID=UPI002FCE8431